MNRVQNATSAHLAPNGSSSGAKFGPPTAPTSSSLNHRTNFSTQSNGGMVSSSVNRTSSCSIWRRTKLQASARFLEGSSIHVAPYFSHTCLVWSFDFESAMTISKSLYVCLERRSSTMSSSSALLMVGINTAILNGVPSAFSKGSTEPGASLMAWRGSLAIRMQGR